MPPDTVRAPMPGEEELAAAVRRAMREYLAEARRAVLDPRTAPRDVVTAAAPDMRRWPEDALWLRAVDRNVRPVVERIWNTAWRRGRGARGAAGRAAEWLRGLPARLPADGWPRRVWAAAQQAVIDSQMGQETPELLTARLRDLLRMDAPGREYRERTARLRQIAQDPSVPAQQRRAARAELVGRAGRPPVGAGMPWEADADRIAQTETVATNADAALNAGRVLYGPDGRKRWVSRRDEDTRPAHRAAHGQERLIDEPFTVDDQALQMPGDPAGSAGNVCNCRCQLEILPPATLAAGAHEETRPVTTTTEAMTAAVTAETDLPFAPRDTPWDGQAAREAVRAWATADGTLDEDKYARAFLYRPDGAPPSAYQLPFATVRDGRLEAVWKGVAAAAAAVNGARGGVDLPDDAVEPVKARLHTLYERAAKEFDDDSIQVPWTPGGMRASLVAAGTMTAAAPVFDGSVDVWDPELFPDHGGRPAAEAFVKPDWLQGPGTLPTPDSIQAEEPFDADKPRIVVYPDGRILGYTATWKGCHVGYPDECVPPPRDLTAGAEPDPTGPGQVGYGNFHRFPVRIADGALRLGKVTMVTVKNAPGHAHTNLNAIRAAAHYDNAASLMAMVRAGEDDHGIWIAGSLLPDVEPGDRIDLALSELSGDWRTVNGVPLQMIASLAVNHGGFLASAGGDDAGTAVAAVADETGGCGCDAAADGTPDAAAAQDAALELGPLDDDLAALVAAVAVETDPSDDDLAALDRDMQAITAATLTAAAGQDTVEGGEEESLTAANWVQQTGTGHLPSYIRRIADHLVDQGMGTSQAIATAVNTVKRMCSAPDGLSFPGVQKVTAKTRAQACKSVTEWEAKKAEARSN